MKGAKPNSVLLYYIPKKEKCCLLLQTVVAGLCGMLLYKFRSVCCHIVDHFFTSESSCCLSASLRKYAFSGLQFPVICFMPFFFYALWNLVHLFLASVKAPFHAAEKYYHHFKTFLRPLHSSIIMWVHSSDNKSYKLLFILIFNYSNYNMIFFPIFFTDMWINKC